MKVTITCENAEATDRVYDLLTCESSGCEILSGSKVCINEHGALPDIVTFDLTKEEVKKVKQLPGVKYTSIDDSKLKFADYTKKPIVGIPKLASYSASFNGRSVTECVPHSLYYCQNYDPIFTHEFPTNGDITGQYTLSTIDCSNVDIIVLDSGVDASHPDFLAEDGVNSRVVNFDWTQLKSGDPINGTQIVSVQPVNYYQDPDGHGTSSASVAAGNRCGFARNASIYALRADGLDPTNGGFTTNECLELALSFQKSKKLNLHGLDSTRPTIFTNSWGYVGPYIAVDLNSTDQNTINLSNSLDVGYGDYYNALNGINSTADAYFRSIIQEGVHTLVSAGNDNIYLTNNPVSSVNVHCFNKTFGEDVYDYVTVRTLENNDSYTLGQTYNSFTYGSSVGTDRRTVYFYSSPNIGLNYSKTEYPIHVVGDLIPVGYNDTDENLFWSAANAKTAYAILSGIDSNETRIINDDSTRYETLSGPFFLKSAYSSFGPDVDIYTPGNGAWSAMSNQVAATDAPFYEYAQNDRYAFFNGTSSACPIAAGILATFLAVNPSATTSEAYQWMQNNSINGNIMQTEMTTLPVSSYNGTTEYTLDMPFGSDISNMSYNPVYTLQKSDSENVVDLFGTGSIYDVLFCNRFFGSKNKIAQAYPLRKAVLNSSNTTETIGGVILTKGSQVDKKVTH